MCRETRAPTTAPAVPQEPTAAEEKAVQGQQRFCLYDEVKNVLMQEECLQGERAAELQLAKGRPQSLTGCCSCTPAYG